MNDTIKIELELLDIIQKLKSELLKGIENNG